MLATLVHCTFHRNCKEVMHHYNNDVEFFREVYRQLECKFTNAWGVK